MLVPYPYPTPHPKNMCKRTALGLVLTHNHELEILAEKDSRVTCCDSAATSVHAEAGKTSTACSKVAATPPAEVHALSKEAPAEAPPLYSNSHRGHNLATDRWQRRWRPWP